jgi:ABC-2 type transport system permease protein
VSLARALHALPTMLRVGVAETVAYRAEFLVWILTTTIPLVMLGLWSTVAAEAPFRQYTQADFVAYFLAVLIVRNVAGSWVGWQIGEEIRMGTMSMRLLRPIHPFIALGASHVASIPFRCVVALPIAVVLLISSGGSSLTTEPLQLAMLLPSLAFAWLITYAIMFAIGALSFFLTRAMGIFSLYFLLFTLLSGYLMPIPMLPEPIATIAEWLPFRFMLALPVELMTERMATDRVLLLMGVQVLWTVASISIAMFVWQRGVRRFEAVGS